MLVKLSDFSLVQIEYQNKNKIVVVFQCYFVLFIFQFFLYIVKNIMVRVKKKMNKGNQHKDNKHKKSKGRSNFIMAKK